MKKTIVMLLIIAVAFIGVVSASPPHTGEHPGAFEGQAPAAGNAEPPTGDTPIGFDGPLLPLPEVPDSIPEGLNVPPFGDVAPPFPDTND